MSGLRKLAEEYNVAVVITNQVGPYCSTDGGPRRCWLCADVCSHACGCAAQVMADPGGMTFAGADNKKARALHAAASCSLAPRASLRRSLRLARLTRCRRGRCARSPSAGTCWRTGPPRGCTSRKARNSSRGKCHSAAACVRLQR